MISHALSLPICSVMFAFEQSNPAGKAIVAVLFLGSVFAWTLMAAKSRELGLARRATERFLSEQRKAQSPVTLFLKRSQMYQASPVFAVYSAACEHLVSAFDPASSVGRSESGRLTRTEMNMARTAAERAVADQSLILENNMGLLATAVTTAPFLGLLGTVWGVMDAFCSMAVVGSAMLSAVAPGISGALLTTVIGLLVALPSAIGYNLMTDRIKRLCVQMDTFAQEFLADAERRYMEG
ncbi:MAG: biopolymer transporter ExbB [Lentisphaerae bacterium]|nr:biopolymer transporter ExbB [Lentisphaerota bacterium]